MEIKFTPAATLKEKPDSSKLVFGKAMTDHMLIIDYDEGQGWHDARIIPYGPLQIDPAAKVLHYGEEIFEGLKAYRTADGSIQLFRIRDNIDRMNKSADRLCMPQIPEELAVSAIKKLVETGRRPGGPLLQARAVHRGGVPCGRLLPRGAEPREDLH